MIKLTNILFLIHIYDGASFLHLKILRYLKKKKNPDLILFTEKWEFKISLP